MEKQVKILKMLSLINVKLLIIDKNMLKNEFLAYDLEGYKRNIQTFKFVLKSTNFLKIVPRGTIF